MLTLGVEKRFTFVCFAVLQWDYSLCEICHEKITEKRLVMSTLRFGWIYLHNPLPEVKTLFMINGC